MPQWPTANINHHNHGPRWWKWPSSAPHEAFHPALMRRSIRGQPPNQVDALFAGIGRLYPSRRYNNGAATTTATATATPPPPSVAIFFIPNKERIHVNSYLWIHRSPGIWIHTFNVWIHIWRCDVWGAAFSLAAPHTSTQHIIIRKSLKYCLLELMTFHWPILFVCLLN